MVHLTGKGKSDSAFDGREGYKQFEYINKEMADLFALADIVISRAGANAICELLALRKPNILIPLSAAASRGDQILNANSFKAHGYSIVLDEDQMSAESLLASVNELSVNKEAYIEKMSQSAQSNAIETIMNLIKENSK